MDAEDEEEEELGWLYGSTSSVGLAAEEAARRVTVRLEDAIGEVLLRGKWLSKPRNVRLPFTAAIFDGARARQVQTRDWKNVGGVEMRAEPGNCGRVTPTLAS